MSLTLYLCVVYAIQNIKIFQPPFECFFEARSILMTLKVVSVIPCQALGIILK